jgi:hypothetical protein
VVVVAVRHSWKYMVSGVGGREGNRNLHFFLPSTCPRFRFGSMISLTRRLSSFVSRKELA